MTMITSFSVCFALAFMIQMQSDLLESGVHLWWDHLRWMLISCVNGVNVLLLKWVH